MFIQYVPATQLLYFWLAFQIACIVYLIMKISLVSILAAGAGLAAASPASIDPRAPGDRGSYTVSGLGQRKQAILNAGGGTTDLAIAMLETENMQTNYPYGQCLSACAAP